RAAIAEAAHIGDIRTILRVLEDGGTDADSVAAGTAPALAAELYRLARRFDAPAIRAALAAHSDPATPGDGRS
ncbi:MAG: hypothetical protein AAGC55_33720, partial [Myxococcota bacterium]